MDENSKLSTYMTFTITVSVHLHYKVTETYNTYNIQLTVNLGTEHSAASEASIPVL